LTRNLIARGSVRLEELHPTPYAAAAGTPSPDDPSTRPQAYATGSVWIDPRTHRVVGTGADGAPEPSHCLYAVGAMTRGQIIDASMAYGLARSTARVAGDWARQLRAPRGRAGP
jgi:hypothetical protein